MDVAERECYQCRSRSGTTTLPVNQTAAVLASVEGAQQLRHQAQVEDRDALFYNLADGICVNSLEYGFAMGCAFALPFAATLLPAARLCRMRSRVAIIGYSSLAVSITLGIQAGAEEYCMLMVMRAIEGVAEGFMLTAALSLTSDMFPSLSAQTIACYALNQGMCIGGGCASLGIMLALFFGWRWANMVLAILGMGVAAIWLATVTEPDRLEAKLLEMDSDIFDGVFNERVARLLTVAAAAKMFAMHSIIAFLPLWFAQADLQGFTGPKYAVANAVVVSIGGIAASMLAAMVAYAGQRSMSYITWHGLASAVLAVPLLCWILLAGDFTQAMIGYLALIALTETWYGPTVLALQAYVRKSVSADAVCAFQMIALAIAGFGPAFAGLLDYWTAELGVNLLWLCITANLIAAVSFWAASQEIMVDPPHNEDLIKKVHPIALTL